MKKLPHDKRAAEGQFCVDLVVTMPDGTRIDFKSKKGARLPEDFVRPISEAVVALLNVAKSERAELVELYVSKHMASLAKEKV